MDERPDAEQRIRDLLVTVAEQIPQEAAEGRRQTVRRARRRIWTVVAGTFTTLAVTAFAVTVGVRAVTRNDATPATPPAPTSSPSYELFAPSPNVHLFVDGRIYEFEARDVRQVGTFPTGVMPQAPVRVDAGILGLVPVGNGTYDVHLMEEPLPDRVSPPAVSLVGEAASDGFAVSAPGHALAYARAFTAALPDERELVETSVAAAGGSSLFVNADGYARPVGYIKHRILVQKGDGAASGVGVWDPVAVTWDLIPGYGRVIGTSAATGRAVLTSGDGTCWVLATFIFSRERAPTEPDLIGLPGCPSVEQVDFLERDPFLLAAVQLPEPGTDDVERVLVIDAEGSMRSEILFPGARQVQWEQDRGTLLVFANPGRRSTYELHRCDVGTGKCVPLWTWTQAPYPGPVAPGEPVWLVEQPG